MSKVKLVLGITGGIASGKSTVLRMLSEAGIPTISADDLAHACIGRGKPGYRAVLRVFGREFLGTTQEIDRRKLGQVVFAKPAMRQRLEKIIHPCVAKGLKQFIQKHTGILALDIPLLFEAKYENWVDKIIVVYCSPPQQLKRLLSRGTLTRQEALQRIAAQLPPSIKCRKADVVIQNTASLSHLRHQVSKLVI